jgi:hypothetical protein
MARILKYWFHILLLGNLVKNCMGHQMESTKTDKKAGHLIYYHMNVQKHCRYDTD